MYISEQEFFTDFNNKDALFWLEEDIVYGDWTGGMNGDGTFEKKGQLTISEVCVFVCVRHRIVVKCSLC